MLNAVRRDIPEGWRRSTYLDRLSFQPVEDAGVEGLASDQEPSDDDCTTRPEEIADLIAAEGTA